MNIEIRRVEPGDYQAVCAVHAQPNVLAGTLQLPFPSEEAWKERLAKFGERDYGLVACVEGEIVGMLSLQVSTRLRRAHVGDLGMAVHDKWAGKGVGSALIKAAIDLADKWLNLSRLELTVYTDNEPALRLYKRLGFEIEGVQRNAILLDGTYENLILMAVLF